MKKLITTVLFCATVFVFAQKGSISGIINDSNQIPLPGAKLTLTPGNYYTISDATGDYVFLNVPEGTYTLTVDYIGYGSQQSTVVVKSENNTSVDVLFDKNKSTTIKEVRLLGISRQNQARALNTQKNNSNITNIVSSDQVGKFPDSNIGDALKRVPGITMQNDQGEARDIIIRGLAPELNSVTLNGNRIPSAEGNNRRVQMDLIPSDMIQLIEVNKTLTPDMDADAIGGSVNLITRTAPNKERISLTAAGGYNPIRDKVSSNTAFMYGNRYFGKKFGFVFNGSYNNQDYGSDNVEAVWAQDKFGNAYIREMDIRKYDVRRERKSLGANFDFKINDKNIIKAGAVYNWRDDWENRYRLRFNKVTPIYDKTDESLITGYKADLRAQTKGGIDTDKSKAARLERQIMQNYFINGEHLLGSQLQLNWSGGYSRASEDRPNERYIDYQSKGVALSGYDSEKEPLLTPTTEPTLKSFKFRTLTEQFGHTFEDEITGKVDLRIPLNIISEQKGRLRFGAKTRIKQKERENSFNDYTPTDANTSLATMDKINPVYWDGKNWSPSSKYIPGYFASKQLLGNLDLYNTGMFSSESNPAKYLGVNYKAKEQIYAGYIRWDQNITDDFSFIAGLRLENTHTEYTGNITKTEDDDVMLEGERKIKNDYTNYLPSITFKYTPTDDMVLRAAYTTSLARPGYYNLSPFVNITPGEDAQINAGNPDLKASYAHNFDVMGEYYFKSVGLISVGGFYKKINKFIFNYIDQNFTRDKFTQQFPDLANDLGADNTYVFSQARNGQSVDVYGFEVALQRQLDFLPGFLSHFGIYANYTYTHSKAKGIAGDDVQREGLMLPGTAPHMFNSSLSWENKRFSARVSLNYTASYLDEIGGVAFDDRYYDKQTFLDANVSYAITEKIRFFVEANNLTNQPLRYYQGEKNRTMQMEYYKPRYNVGLKFDF